MRSPCCNEAEVKKGPWTAEEDKLLIYYIQEHGVGSWRNIPKKAGLKRCGKSCRLRWTNYLRPDIKRGKFSEEEEKLIIHLHSVLGNKWSTIATRLDGRTDNEIKNYWNTHLKKKLLLMGIDPVTHRPQANLDTFSNILTLLASSNLNNFLRTPPLNINVLRLQTDATQLAKVQIMQSLIQLLAASNSSPTIDDLSLLASSSPSLVNHNQAGSPNQHLDPAISLMDILSFRNSPFVNSFPSQSNNFTANSTPLNPTLEQIQEQVYSNNVSPNSLSSTHFEAWDGLNHGAGLRWDDYLINQGAWSNASQVINHETKRVEAFVLRK